MCDILKQVRAGAYWSSRQLPGVGRVYYILFLIFLAKPMFIPLGYMGLLGDVGRRAAKDAWDLIMRIAPILLIMGAIILIISWFSR
ncbi:hypothetical protein HGA91_06175 [candidate division WWE3 bacterium]|nr:hypothetical protein [candidate division WWE3 bacterium]